VINGSQIGSDRWESLWLRRSATLRFSQGEFDDLRSRLAAAYHLAGKRPEAWEKQPAIEKFPA